jgi:cytochrome b subunit of formate dehydrogenase
MNKPLFGLLLGSILGLIDGLTAWFTPPVRQYMLSIVIGSTFKGLVTGVLMGLFARKVNSVPLGSLIGLSLGLLFAWLVAMQPTDDVHYYWEIMIPGSIVGLIVGFATQRYGTQPTPA